MELGIATSLLSLITIYTRKSHRKRKTHVDVLGDPVLPLKMPHQPGTFVYAPAVLSACSYTRLTSNPCTDEGYEFENNFKPRCDDIIIATFPKTGNTLLSQLSHQIRRPGDSSYEDIYEVCPFLEFLWPLGVDDAENQKSLRFNTFKPRIFKHHKYLSACYQGGKYVCT